MNDITPLEYSKVSQILWERKENPTVSYSEETQSVEGAAEKVAAFNAEVTKLRNRYAAIEAINAAGYDSLEEAVAALVSA